MIKHRDIAIGHIPRHQQEHPVGGKVSAALYIRKAVKYLFDEPADEHAKPRAITEARAEIIEEVYGSTIEAINEATNALRPLLAQLASSGDRLRAAYAIGDLRTLVEQIEKLKTPEGA